MENQKPKGQQIDIELTEEVSEGVYSNSAIISHSSSEFVIDFLRILPNVPKTKVKTRVVVTPEHAKRLCKALEENISKFEKIHGKIVVRGGHQIPTNFGGPTAQA